MIAIDTNVLIRYFVEDEPAQAALAKDFIESELSAGSPGLVTLVALVELEWVLRKALGVSREVVVAALRKLLNAPQIIVEEFDAVERWLDGDHADLADILIHQIGRAHGCERTVTFDQRFARLDGVELLA